MLPSGFFALWLGALSVRGGQSEMSPYHGLETALAFSRLDFWA
jgi:hypothetical protein